MKYCLQWGGYNNTLFPITAETQLDLNCRFQKQWLVYPGGFMTKSEGYNHPCVLIPQD